MQNRGEISQTFKVESGFFFYSQLREVKMWHFDLNVCNEEVMKHPCASRCVSPGSNVSHYSITAAFTPQSNHIQLVNWL